MSADCCSRRPANGGPRYRAILWIALAANAAMFFVELAAGIVSGSASLAADAADFAGDAASYGLSLAAMAAGGLWASRTAFLKGYAMGVYGMGVLAYTAWRVAMGVPPEPLTMGVVGALALTANLSVAWLLYAYRNGNADMRSVWLCTRNDALGNLAVLAAAAGIFGTGTLWPDVAAALLISGLSLLSSREVIRRARAELGALRSTHPVESHP